MKDVYLFVGQMMALTVWIVLFSLFFTLKSDPMLAIEPVLCVAYIVVCSPIYLSKMYVFNHL